MKHLLLFLLAFGTTASFGQKQVVSAYNANKSGDYAEAAQYIEEAILIEKAAVKEKTWRYRGNIYLNIAVDTTLQAAFPDALWTARDSYLQARELDGKGSYDNEIIMGLGRIQTTANNLGIYHYNASQFNLAARKFDLASAIATEFNAVDTMAVFNAALCYEKSDEIDLAIERYKRCSEIEYQVPNVYLFIAALLLDADRTEEALEELQAARKLFPKAQGLIIEELNIYLNAKDFERAVSNLELAADQDPTNEVLWYSLGSVYDQLDRTEEAIESYNAALAINPTYFDANYNLGALHFNEAVIRSNEADEMWHPKMSKGETLSLSALELEVETLFATALPFLEMAHTTSPEDIDTIRSLRDIYTRTKNDEKMLEMMNLLKVLGS